MSPKLRFAGWGPIANTLALVLLPALVLAGCSSSPVTQPQQMNPVANPGGPYYGEAVITFDGRGSTDPSGAQLKEYAWDFGDGTIGNGPTARHTYSTRGTYSVTLIVTDAQGMRSDPGKTNAVIADSITTSAVLVGAGNIAQCSTSGDERTADLLDSIPGTVMTLGDHAYPTGSADNFTRCYEPSWGRHRARTFPSIGNHEYDPGTPQPYFDYFGKVAGDPTKGYYSYELGAWHIIVLNTGSTTVATELDSPQGQWLQADLASNTKRCTLAYWHHPRFYQGDWGKNGRAKPFWDLLYEWDADVVVNGHFHLYERYAPQTPDGIADPIHGIREFIVGTGGADLDSLDVPSPTVEARSNTTFGVLKLTLRPRGYDWEFIPTAQGPGRFTDSGSGTCH